METTIDKTLPSIWTVADLIEYLESFDKDTQLRFGDDKQVMAFHLLFNDKEALVLHGANPEGEEYLIFKLRELLHSTITSIGGSATSEKKQASSKLNGAKGGRPKNV